MLDAFSQPAEKPAPGPTIVDLAPGDAALILLIRTDRIYRSPYEHEVRRLLEVFYDYKTLLWSSGLDPIKDFKTLLIATPNPYRVTRTFLAARHTLPSRKLRRALEHATYFKKKRIRWSRPNSTLLRGEIPSPPKLPHDPRVVLLGRSIVLLTDPQYIPLLSATRFESSPPSSSDAGSPRPTWFERLGQMSQGQTDGPGLILEAINLPRLVRLPPNIPMPLAFKVSIKPVAPTTVKGMIRFSNSQHARRFLVVIPKRIKEVGNSLILRFLGVTDLLNGIRFKQRKEKVEASVTISGTQVRNLLELVRGMIPQVTVPGMNPRLSPDGSLVAPDTGTSKVKSNSAPTRLDAGPNDQTVDKQR